MLHSGLRENMLPYLLHKSLQKTIQCNQDKMSSDMVQTTGNVSSTKHLT